MTAHTEADLDQMLKSAAELFGVLSAPVRLHIIRVLCHGEKSVGQLLSEVKTTQPNMSQHLNLLYRQGVLKKRREGVQIHYAIADPQIVAICQAMCDCLKTLP